MPLPPALHDALAAILGDRLSTSDSQLDLHGRDESSLPPCRPDAVVFPESTAEVSAVLAACNEHGVPVVPFAGGSSLEGQVLPIHGGLSLDRTAWRGSSRSTSARSTLGCSRASRRTA